jgi:hypothetical protein
MGAKKVPIGGIIGSLLFPHIYVRIKTIGDFMIGVFFDLLRMFLTSRAYWLRWR